MIFTETLLNITETFKIIKNDYKKQNAIGTRGKENQFPTIEEAQFMNIFVNQFFCSKTFIEKRPEAFVAYEQQTRSDFLNKKVQAPHAISRQI